MILRKIIYVLVFIFLRMSSKGFAEKREESASVRYVALSDLAELQRVESVKFALNAKAYEE